MNVLLTTTGSDTLSAHFWTPLPPLRNLSFSNPTSLHRALLFLKHGHSTHTSQVQTPALGQCTPLTPSQMHLLLKPTTSFCTGFLSASLPVHTDLVRYCNLSGLPRSCIVSERGSLMEPRNTARGKPSAPILHLPCLKESYRYDINVRHQLLPCTGKPVLRTFVTNITLSITNAAFP